MMYHDILYCILSLKKILPGIAKEFVADNLF